MLSISKGLGCINCFLGLQARSHPSWLPHILICISWKMYTSIEDLLRSTTERDMDLAFLATKSLSIDATVRTVPVIHPRQNQASLKGVCGEVPVVNARHALHLAEPSKKLSHSSHLCLVMSLRNTCIRCYEVISSKTGDLIKQWGGGGTVHTIYTTI